MKVIELIELLEEQDPDATVLLAIQRSWPFECSLAGVAVRSEMRDEDGDEPSHDPDVRPNDVLLVEGQQLRYGSKAAWDVAER